MSAEHSQNIVDLAREADFTLGGMAVRPSTRELVAGGRAELLEPRIMQVLVALSRRRGQVVSRDDLIDACWGGRVVGEDAINRCISAIRKLSEAHGGFLITTVARVGYRLDESALPFAKPALRLPVLAVLAFDNLSGDPDMAWFSDGVSEEILDSMARVSGIRVIGRTSSFHFRGPDKTVRRIAEALRATHLLDGSVRRSGAKVRVSAQLIECAGETALWAGRFDREISDVFTLQDEIAATVATALNAVLVCPPPSERGVDPAALEPYLRSRTWGERMPSEQRLALAERAVALAPNFAAGWAWVGHLLANQASYNRRGAPLAPLRARAQAALANALRLDPSLALPHASACHLEPFAAFARRESLLDSALERAPSDVVILYNRTEFFDETGRFREALACARRSQALDPLNPGALSWLAAETSRLGSYTEALAMCEDGRARWPQEPNFYTLAAQTAAFARDWPRLEDAILLARADPFGDTVDDRDKQNMEATFNFLEALRDGVQTFADRTEQRIEERLRRNGRVALSSLHAIAAFGRIDEAFAFAERASFARLFEPGGYDVAGDWNAGFVLSVHINGPMVADPRFASLCARIGLADYWVTTDRWPDCADDGVLPYDFKAECRRLVAN